MPKAFLLTNKRYNIWKQINETFKAEQRKKKLLQEETARILASHQYFDHRGLDLSTSTQYSDSTDYSKYTNTSHEEGNI